MIFASFADCVFVGFLYFLFGVCVACWVGLSAYFFAKAFWIID